MNWNFNYVVVLFLLAFSTLAAQEIDSTGNTTIEKDYLELGLGYLVPKAYGNNFVAKGYGLSNGLSLNLDVLIRQKWSIGTQFDYYEGEVSDITRTGAFGATKFYHFYIRGGYPWKLMNNKIVVRAIAGIGYAQYRQEIDFFSFKDDGHSVVFELNISYRLSKYFGVFLGLRQSFDFLDIRAPQELNNYFKNPKIFNAIIGMKVYF